MWAALAGAFIKVIYSFNTYDNKIIFLWYIQKKNSKEKKHLFMIYVN